MKEMINVTRSSMPELAEYIEEIRDLWDTHYLTNMGVKHETLRAALENFLSVPHVTLFANGHLALENALAAFRFPPGSEIITTPFTFASTTHAIVRNGLVPVFCDIRENDFTLDCRLIRPLITKRTKAILPVHVYGHLCDTEALARIASEYGLRLIYDAAHAFGVSREGVSAACFGDISMFSFHATKVFNTIEGGALCYADDDLTKILDDLKNFGMRDESHVEYAGGNAKMNEFQAAMGICNLRHVREDIAGRKIVYEHYYQRLSNVSGIRLPAIPENTEANYSYFPMIFDGYKYTRDEVSSRLMERGVRARKYFSPLTSAFSCYQSAAFADPGRTPVAMYAADHILTLPLYPELTKEQVDFISDIILS